jgi:AhpD family alkylhydroperoxidase
MQLMPRVTALPSAALPPAIAEVYDRFTAYGPFADQAAVMAHVPPALDHLYRMLMELKARQAVPWRYIELSIVVASKLNACSYCVASHSPVLEIEGLSAAAIAQLPNADHPDLDDVDRLVIEYATLVTQGAGRIRDGVFERLRLHFSEAQIVELTLRIALAGFFNRFNDALQIDDGIAAARLDDLISHPATTETSND